MLFPTARTLMSVVLLAGAAGATAQPSTPPARAAPPSIETKTAGMQKLDGFVPLYWDEAEGRVYLEIARFGVEMLHSNGFASGLGSNDIGLDRGALAGSRIVTFERVGPKVLLVQPNYDFRASSTNPEEVRAVRDAFARSVLWGFTVAAESEGRVLVDATEWLVRDNLNLAPRLRPGQLQARREAQQPLPRRHLQLPEEHRARGRAHLRAAAVLGAAAGRRRARVRPRLRRRSLLRGRGQRGREQRGREPARPPLLHRAAGARLPAARPGPARRLLRHLVPGALGAPGRAARAAVRRPPPAREDRPWRQVEPGEEADRLLPRPRHAGARPLRPARRRTLVGRGVRGRGLQGRVPRRDAARRTCTRSTRATT